MLSHNEGSVLGGLSCSTGGFICNGKQTVFKNLGLLIENFIIGSS